MRGTYNIRTENARVDEILADPAAFIESREFFSWEQFFNEVLVQEIRDSYLKYSKRKLNPVFLEPKKWRR